MDDKADVPVGTILKLTKTKDGWKHQFDYPEGGISSSFATRKTFDEAVAHIRANYDLD